VRKRVAVVGISEEGLSLIPLLEANPEVEICAIVTTDEEAALEGLRRVDRSYPDAFRSRLSGDLSAVLAAPGLTAVVDADAPPALREGLAEAPGRGVQVTTPLIAKLLFAFGPVDASRKPDLLQTLSEILESYNLTVDRRGLLNRILQIAVGATGAERGSLMLWDEPSRSLRVEVAIGIERELLPKIRVHPGEGVAGRAFEDATAILLEGKADQTRYRITRERDDVESAISAPLLHDGRVIGVLNLSCARRRQAFDQEDLEFVRQLARLDAKIIARAEEYHALLKESATLRSQAEVRRILAAAEPLERRLGQVCRFVAEELRGGLCDLYLRDPDRDTLVLQASSSGFDVLAAPHRVHRDRGILGWVARASQPVVLSERIGGARVCYAALPLRRGEELLGVLAFEGAHEGEFPELLRDRLSAAAEALADELADVLRSGRMEREATKAGAITELAARMSTCADSAELHRTISSSAAMILEAEHAVLRLQDETSGRFQIRSYFGSAETDQQRDLFALEKELAIEAIRQRTALRVVDLSARGDERADELGLSSAIVQPLRREGRVIGTLSVLGKALRDPLSGESFAIEDERTLARLAEHAQAAVATVHELERTRRRQRFDDLTGLPNAPQLRDRLEEEISRSAGRGRTLALVRLRVGGLAELLEAQSEAEGDRTVLSIAQELRAGLRDFDVLARTAADTFEALLPEPEGDVAALLGPLARRAREAIRREPGGEALESAALEFGYALFPDEGRTAKELEARAAESRIRSL
jgi:GAF domain-containing protein